MVTISLTGWCNVNILDDRRLLKKSDVVQSMEVLFTVKSQSVVTVSEQAELLLQTQQTMHEWCTLPTV